MAATTFTWTPSYGAQQSTEQNVRTVKFGDGYEQRLRYGLRTLFETWTIRFDNVSVAERSEIVTYLRARAGAEQFNWTTPEGRTTAFVCDEFGVEITQPSRFTITATFREVIDL
jgi:phage-related protein